MSGRMVKYRAYYIWPKRRDIRAMHDKNGKFVGIYTYPGEQTIRERREEIEREKKCLTQPPSTTHSRT